MTVLPDSPPSLRAIITFLPTDEGGRDGPAQTGLRPLFSVDGENWISVHEYIEPKEASPGSEVLTDVYLLSPDRAMAGLEVGSTFDVCEGSRTIAHGRITKIHS